MKQMRAGLSAAGYVKHETWVLPENRSLLKQMEKQLRQPILAGSFMSEDYMSAGNNWNIDRLYSALQALDEVVSNDITLSLVQGSESSIKLETAVGTLNRLQAKQQQRAAELEAQDQLADASTGTDLERKLREAGITPNEGSANAILERLKKKSAE